LTSCQSLPFSDLGFVPYDENMWIKFTEGTISVPHFAITTTINPQTQTFVIKDLLLNKTISTNSYDVVREFVISNIRNGKIKKILD
jgi:hypothetical protein